MSNTTVSTSDSDNLRNENEVANQTITNETELAKLSIEKQKLKIEMQKLEIERSKLLYSSLLGIIPLLAVVFTIFYGIWTQRQQEKTQFQLKAAEIMFNSKDAFEIKDRANILKIILSDRLPANFAQAFYPDSLGFNDMYSVSAKIEILKMLSSKAASKEEIVDLWRQIFPRDHWADTLRVK